MGEPGCTDEHGLQKHKEAESAGHLGVARMRARGGG